MYKSVLHVSDVKTLYPNQGVSDAVMQLLISLSGNDHFFNCGHSTYTTLTCSQILPRKASEYVSGALAYSAIVSVCSAANSTDSELKRNFLNTNGFIDISHPLLLFPCPPQCKVFVFHNSPGPLPNHVYIPVPGRLDTSIWSSWMH